MLANSEGIPEQVQHIMSVKRTSRIANLIEKWLEICDGQILKEGFQEGVEDWVGAEGEPDSPGDGLEEEQCVVVHFTNCRMGLLRVESRNHHLEFPRLRKSNPISPFPS